MKSVTNTRYPVQAYPLIFRTRLIFIGLISILANPLYAGETVRIVSQNMNRFFDNIDDGKNEKVLSSAKFYRNIETATRTIIDQFALPDILALQEVENRNVLSKITQAVYARSGVRYQIVLLEGNDYSAINVAYLVKQKFNIQSVKQLYEDKRLPYDQSMLFSRPPLYLEACIEGASINSDFFVIARKHRAENRSVYKIREESWPQRSCFGSLSTELTPQSRKKIINRGALDSSCVSLLNLHLRSMRGIRSTSKGKRVRLKRLEQASSVARWIEHFQQTRPQSSLLVLGDFNGLTPSDPYVDVVGTILGRPDNSNTQETAKDWVDRDLIDLTRRIPPANRYSYIYRKKKQILDYMLTNSRFKLKLKAIAFSRINYKFSDHAALIADFAW